MLILFDGCLVWYTMFDIDKKYDTLHESSQIMLVVMCIMLMMYNLLCMIFSI